LIWIEFELFFQEDVCMVMKRNLITGGLTLTLRNWPALVWTYVFNLGLAWMFSIPLHNQISAITAHSFASQRLTGGFDLGVMADVIRKLGAGPGSAASASVLSTPIYLLLYFLIVPGTLLCYQTDVPARLSTLIQTGLLYFWRFVRITLVSLVVFGVVLGILMAIQNRWAAHVDATSVGRSAWLSEMAGIVLIGLVAAFLRVYFDLVEVYTVQLSLEAPIGKASNLNRRIRRVFLPAWRAYRENFLRAYLSFLLLTLLGMSAVIITARIAMHSLAQPRTWPLLVLAQIGLFFMLLTRFWQRGAETVLAQDNALTLVVVAAVPVEPVRYEGPPVIVEG
jgi:hypothetical protein